MASGASHAAQLPTGACGIEGLVEQLGTAQHRYPAGPMLRTGRQTTRNLADAVHALCELHGFHPDLVTLAHDSAATDAERRWLDDAADAFAEERGLLTRIVVAAGPIPSTPGQAESETAMIAQRHALEMLGRSERGGCAIGAIAALLIDWRAVRELLDRAADRFGLSPTRCRLPEPADVLAFVAEAAGAVGPSRAALFGAQQYLLQQRGLWDLLEAREVARRES